MNKPKIVLEWEESMSTIESMCPQCCFTCSHLNGVNCTAWGKAPPEEFMSKIGECKKWNRLPF